jgi:hypothetical protein
MYYYIALVGLSTFNSFNSFSQSIINGSFEDNSASACLFNMSNTSFNSVVEDCFAFGFWDPADFEGLDLMDNSCNVGAAQNGNYFIGLEVSTSPMIEFDALSMSLNTPLIAGTSYTVSFYTRTMDVNSTNSINIGYSSTNNSFGTLIGSSGTPTTSWTQSSFTFTPTTNGSYITILANPTVDNGWTAVDDVTLTSNGSSASLEDISNNFKFYPNPSNGIVTISNAELGSSIQVLDATGRIVSTKISTTENTVIDLSENISGIYFVHIQTASGDITTKKLILRK